MSTPVNSDLVAEALLRYFRDPVQYRAEMLQQSEVTGNLDLVVRLALGRPVEFASPALLGAGMAQELGRAAVFFVQQILFRDGASHYQLLGLSPNAPPEAIRGNHKLLIQVVHPDRHNTPVEWPESVAARVNRAYSVLRNAETRAAYDEQEAAARSKPGFGPHAATSAYPAGAGVVVRTRQQVPVSVLPEWLTDSLGGFVREHPTFTIFASLISLSVLVISGAIWSEHGVTLVLDPARVAAAPGPTPGARVFFGPPKDGARVSPMLIETQEASSAKMAEKSPAPMVRPAAASRTTSSAEAVVGSSRRPVLQGEPLAVASSPRSPVLRSEPVAVAEPAPPAMRLAVATPRQSTLAAITEAGVPLPLVAPSVQVAAASQQAAPSITTETVVATPAAPLAKAVAPPPASPASPAVQAVAAVGGAAARPVVAPSPAEPLPEALSQAPSSAEVETLIAAFISFYESGRLDAFAALFDVDAQTNEFRGRAAIRSDYNELFQRSSWRRINLRQLKWRPVGERTEANGEMALKIGWRDGREVEQRIAVEMELIRRGNRAVITRLSQQVRN